MYLNRSQETSISEVHYYFLKLSLILQASLRSWGFFSTPLPRIIRSAPALNKSSTSFAVLIPPPTATGIDTFSLTAFTILIGTVLDSTASCLKIYHFKSEHLTCKSCGNCNIRFIGRNCFGLTDIFNRCFISATDKHIANRQEFILHILEIWSSNNMITYK